MRKIKFMEWNKVREVMVSPKKLTFNEFLTVEEQFDDEDFDYLQYIGLNGMDDIEIYDGFIIDFFGVMMAVEWNDRKACFVLVAAKGKFDILMLSQESAKDYKVIGNIYENPELLDDAFIIDETEL